MAKIGFKYLAWGKLATEPTASVPTYDTGKVLGKAVSSSLAITNAEGKLYADNTVAENISEFTSAMLTMEVDNISLSDQATMYGATYADDEIQFGASDNAPYGGVGGYQVLSVNNVRKYRAWFFPKAKALVPDETDNTKTNSISFGTQPLNLDIQPPAYGPWRYVKEFTTEAAAQAYIDTKLGVATWHKINVQVNGADAGEAATPVGVTYVANAGAFELTVTGTATALYDNGVESKLSIVAGKYTLSNVTAAHEIAVIF
jgi:phi13 family phage major tail protein